MHFFLTLSLATASQSFLSQPIPSTSSGILASGIANIDHSISSLSSQLSTSLQSLDLKLDSSINLSTSALTALLSSEIASKRLELDSINSEIHTLLHSTENLYTKCGSFRSCEACQYNPQCVWCEVEQLCVGGDADGPFHGECEYFSYRSCYVNGCKRHTGCNSCVQALECGWCLNGGECSEDIKDCDNLLWIHMNKPGSECPSESFEYFDVYVNENPSQSVESDAIKAERRVNELRNQSVRIVQDIQQLEFVKAQVLADAKESLSIGVGDIKVQEESDDLQARTDHLAAKEINELKNSFETPKPEATVSRNSTDRLI